MFGFKKKMAAAKESYQKIENKDLMEAIIASAIVVAFADGNASDEELKAMQAIIESHDALAHFGNEIGVTIDRYAKKMQASKFLGKAQLMREIADIKGDDKQKEDVALVAVSIAYADGECSDVEKAILKEIGKVLSVNMEQYF